MLSKRVHGKPLVYLDSAATSLKPNCVIDAMTQFYQTSYGTVHRAAYALSSEATARYQGVREKIQRFINASLPEEVVFTRGTTEGINLIARSYGDAFLKPGDEILISGQEHHSNIVPWQLLSSRTGAYLKVIPLHPDGQIDLERFHDLLSERTRLVSVAQISNVLGIHNPLQEIISAAHRIGAKVVVDAAQSAPHVPLDVQALDPDFLVFSSHKLYGPTGVGVLFGKKEILRQMPPYQGGGDMIQTVTFEKTTYQDPPLRFEAGTPMIAEVIGLGAAIDYLQTYEPVAKLQFGAKSALLPLDSFSPQIAYSESSMSICGEKDPAANSSNLASKASFATGSYGAIQEYEHQLMQLALQSLPAEVSVLGPREGRCSLVTFQVPGIHPLDLATLLDLQGIAVRSGHLCAQPLLRHFGQVAAVRFSLAPYNTPDEVVYFCEILKNSILKFIMPRL